MRNGEGVDNEGDKERQETVQERSCTCRCCDILWVVTTVEGWLKLIEWIFTLLTFVILSTFPHSSKPKYEFLVFLATTAWVFVFMHIGLRMLHLYEKLPSVMTQPLVSFVACTLAWIGFLIGSSIVYSDGITYNDTKALEVSGICGFVCTCLFAVESIYYFIRFRRSVREGTRAEAEAIDASDFVEPSN